MGICLVAYTITDAHLDEVLADPLLIWRVVEAEDESKYLRELASSAKRSLWARMFGAAKPAPIPRSMVFSSAELRPLDLDKSWDGLNACLKRCSPASPNFFEGAGRVGHIEIGYGPALYHRSETVSLIAAGYLSVKTEQMLEAMRSVDLTEVYLKGLWERKDNDSMEYLAQNFEQLQAYLRHASEHSLGVIIQFT